ncbi:hypothetical protein DV738_g2286, partial [Chaetothyriales sp. CBS 135597]
MKSALVLGLAVGLVSALISDSQTPIIDGQDAAEEASYLIEISPGETKWVREEEKWELKRNGINFFDITDTGHTFPHVPFSQQASVSYPPKPVYNASVQPLLETIEQKNMRQNLEKFTSFHTRYYKSDYGIQSAEWLFGQVSDIITGAGADKHGVTVSKFPHPWGQFSIIAHIPGKSNSTVVIGAHQDSINLFLPSFFAAPGADDDGSGTVTILEALRVILQSEDIVKGKAENALEFHWYSAEEGGLLGSAAIFKSYFDSNRDIKAMIQQDMTGFIAKTIEAGEPESVGVITDYVDAGLTAFIKEIIKQYCDIPYVETRCGYACSDHASASKYGYPSAFVIESDFKYSDNKIHTTDDKIEYLSFDHMEQHCKMTTGFAYELAFTKF